MNKLNAKKYKEMLLYGAEMMNAHKEEINALNVFPVPDGDTGSNMNMTIQSGVKSITNLETDDISEVAKTFSKGLLMGARGNSGVILSQYFRGIAEGLDGKQEVTTSEYKTALNQGVKRAYASVIKAVEGTMLTVCREMSENVVITDDFKQFFESLLFEANKSLENTPELLAVLKEVGVVDSGGKGVFTIFQGMQASVNGEELDLSDIQSFEEIMQMDEHPMNPEDIVFGYCTEMLISVDEPDKLELGEVRSMLQTFGDSIVAIADEDILKVHVHTETPIKVFEYGKTLGDFVHIKSENMRHQAMEAVKNSSVIKEQAIVAVASSNEIGKLFNKIQSVSIISGGQTMNPSTEDIINAIKAANAKKVIILPNNSNIIMSAKAARNLLEDIEVEVVETKHITQAIELLINYSEDLDFETNVINMKEAIGSTTNIEITNAIKDTSIEGVEIHKDDFLGIVDGKIKYSIKEIKDLLITISDMLIEKDVEVINILLGEGSDKELVEQIVDYIEDKEPFMEVEVFETNQPVYSYLISGV